MKKEKIHKTNAARELDKKSINYELLNYEVDEKYISAIYVAKFTNQDIRQVYKTIVCVGDEKEFIVACIQGDLELDLKALAIASGHKRCELLHLKDLEKTTGYIRGGCSPLTMKKTFRTFIDKRAQDLDKILVSAGVKGKQLKLDPKDLCKATNAIFCDIAIKLQ